MFDALEAEVDRACALVLDALNVQQQLAVLERCERLRRRIPAIEHPLINSLARQAPSQELGGTLSHALTESVLISRAEASRRVKEAADLGPRHGLTGEPVPPVLAATAAAQRAGKLGAGQVAVIRTFYHQLPGWIDTAARDDAEARLAKLAGSGPCPRFRVTASSSEPAKAAACHMCWKVQMPTLNERSYDHGGRFTDSPRNTSPHIDGSGRWSYSQGRNVRTRLSATIGR